MGKQKNRRRIVGMSYAKRVADINAIYDEYRHSGLSNREILRRYIWPKYAISERTFYNIVNALCSEEVADKIDSLQLTLDL